LKTTRDAFYKTFLASNLIEADIVNFSIIFSSKAKSLLERAWAVAKTFFFET
jgi:hypothetical protein